MEGAVRLKRRAYLGLASPPAILTAVLLFALLATIGGFLAYLLAGLDRNEALITASIGAVTALLVHAMQIMGSPAVACVLGVDGIEVTHGFDVRAVGRFVPWSAVLGVERDGSAVRFKLRDELEFRVRPWSQPLYLDAVNLLEGFRKRDQATEADGYRELETSEPVLVRVAQDPRQDAQRRKLAYEKLSESKRAEVLSSLADPETREAFHEVE